MACSTCYWLGPDRCGEICPTCQEHVDLDNCDGDLREGAMVYFAGSTKGQQCEACTNWTHIECLAIGPNVTTLCLPCAVSERSEQQAA